MGHGPRRSHRRLLLGALATVTLAAGAAIPASAFALDYPVPPPPTVGPTTVTRTTTPTTGTVPTEVKDTAVAKKVGVEVLGAQVTRGSMPITGGDVAALAAIGAGAVAVGAVMVRRTRRAGAKT
jgi:hypothetical protein